MEKRPKGLRLVITIVNRKVGKKVIKLYEKFIAKVGVFMVI